MAVEIGINQLVANGQTVASEFAMKPRVHPATCQSAVSVFDTNSIIGYILADHSHPRLPHLTCPNICLPEHPFNEMGDF